MGRGDTPKLQGGLGIGPADRLVGRSRVSLAVELLLVGHSLAETTRPCREHLGGSGNDTPRLF